MRPWNSRPILRGMGLIEVMIALVILGVISVIYMKTNMYAQKNTGKGIDWQAESVVLEKTIENLRVGFTVTQLQSLDSSTVDSSQGKVKVNVHIVGAVPSSSVATGFTASRLAQITVTAKRLSYNDSITVTTYLWVN